ncbi:MAG TPA: hypothetical protein VFF76_09610 [Holophagaceae bacterium]|jgi:hypothetical protein|nr:hypothetical protein [Holophagaceae bacterium]
MQPDSIHQRFRILLHILNRLDSPRRAEVPRRLDMETSVTQHGLSQTDWLGHETELFRIAIAAIADLEQHLQATTSRTLQQQYWKMERRMVACACESHRTGIPWRALELDQFTRLQSLIEGLVGAFLEDEAVFPAFVELADREECQA